MSEKNFTPQESLSTIENALKQTSAQKSGAAFYYILWGALLFIYFILQFFALRNSDKSDLLQSFAWVVFPIGGLLSFLQSRKDDKQEKAIPLYEKVYAFTWGGVGLALGVFTLLGVFSKTFLDSTILILLTGLATFITGGVLKFIPSIAGGTICIICAGLSQNFSLEGKFLLAAAGVLFACLIPGILMKCIKTNHV